MLCDGLLPNHVEVFENSENLNVTVIFSQNLHNFLEGFLYGSYLSHCIENFTHDWDNGRFHGTLP